MTNNTIEGKLLLYSETGMEGGHLSIQDLNYITYSPSTYPIINNCKVWDSKDTSRQGTTSNVEVLIENQWSEPSDLTRGIPHGTKTRVTVKWKDGTVQEKITSDNLLVEQWDYKGLHFLKTDDILKVMDPITDNIVCEGQINKIQLNVFSETSKGHFNQINDHGNCKWETYFNENYAAQVIRK